MRYTNGYNRRNKVSFNLKVGDKVQYRKYKVKQAKGQKTALLWKPLNSFVIIQKIDKSKKKLTCKDKKGAIIATT